jgi:hypothetical protein
MVLYKVRKRRLENASPFRRHISAPVAANLDFGEWVGSFGVARMTTAWLDRLTHRCRILATGKASHRCRRSIIWPTLPLAA